MLKTSDEILVEIKKLILSERFVGKDNSQYRLLFNQQRKEEKD
jgi:hypothetical protein